MKTGKRLLYLVIILLLCEIAKSVVTKAAHPVSFLISSLIACLQWFLLLGVIILYFLRLLVPASWSLRKKRIFSGVIVFLLFGTAEMICSYWLNNPRQLPSFLQRSFFYYYDTYDFRVIQFEKEQSIYDPALMYRLRPGGHFKFRNREFSTQYRINSAGLRDDEVSLDKPDIICLGDSYAMGWGVEQDESFAQQLEHVSGLRVLNASVSSYGTARELKLLNQLDTSSIRFIIIQYCYNDIAENFTYKNHQFKLPVSSEDKFNFLQSEYRLGRVYFPGKHFLLIGQIFVKQQLNKIYPLFNLPMERYEPIHNAKEQANVFMELLSHAGLDKTKAKIIVLTMGNRYQIPNQFSLELRMLLLGEKFKNQWANRIVTVPVDQVLNNDDFFDLDLHVRSSGHHKIAKLLWEEIREN